MLFKNIITKLKDLKYNRNARRAETAKSLNKTQSKKRPILLKLILIGVGTIATLVVALIVWIGVSLFSGPDAMEMSEYHPFRSPEAKERYLKSYDMRAKYWPVDSETKTVETSCGQTFVRLSGPADAPPLVLLAGSGGNAHMWIPNIEALSADYRAYAMDDIYGYGRSVFTRTMSNSDDIVSWLDELFTALELGDHINIMGISYGGWQVSQYALRFANRLDKIVLIAPAATILPLSEEWVRRAILMMVPHRYFVKSMYFWILEDLANKDEASQKIVEEWSDDIFMALRCFKLKMLVLPTVLTDKELQSIKVPALFLVGENEKIYSAQKAVQRLHELAPQVETEIIPDCGHDLTIVQTDTVNHRILQFLKQP